MKHISMRKEEFDNKMCSFTGASLLKKLEENNLQLRKKKLNEMIMTKRLKVITEQTESANEILELKTSDVNLPMIVQRQFDSSSDPIGFLAEYFNSLCEEENLFALVNLRKYLNKNNITKTDIVRIAELIWKHIKEILTTSIQPTNTLLHYKMKFEASWIVINLIAESEQFEELLSNMNILVKLEQLMHNCFSCSEINLSGLLKHIMWIFANILGGNAKFSSALRVFIPSLPNVIINVLMGYSEKKYKDLIETGLFTLQNYLLYLKPEEKVSLKPHLEAVFQIIHQSIKEVRPGLFLECLKVMKLFVNSPPLVESFVENRIVEFMLDCYEKVTLNTESLIIIIKIIAEILSGDNCHTKHIMSLPLLNMLIELSEEIVNKSEPKQDDMTLYKEILLTMANIAGTDTDNAKRIIFDSNIIYLLTSSFFKYNDHPQIKFEILFIFHNAFSVGDNRTKSELIKLNILRLFTDELLKLLKDNKIIMRNISTNNEKVIFLIIEGLHLFIKYGEENYSKFNVIQKEIEMSGVVDVLYKLHLSGSREINKQAEALLKIFWDDDQLMFADEENNFNLIK